MFFKKLIFLFYKKFIQLKWKVLKPYYAGIAVQARFLYQQSELFKLRWQQLGLDFARESFDNNPSDGEYFFRKAQKEPFIIRFHIFMDALTGKEPRPYYVEKGQVFEDLKRRYTKKDRIYRLLVISFLAICSIFCIGVIIFGSGVSKPAPVWLRCVAGAIALFGVIIAAFRKKFVNPGNKDE